MTNRTSTQFSFLLNTPGATAQMVVDAVRFVLNEGAAWASAQDGVDAMGFDEIFLGVDMVRDDEDARELAAGIFRALVSSGTVAHQDLNDEEILDIGLTVEATNGHVTFLAEESGNAQATAAIVCAILRARKLPPVGFNYVESGPTMKPPRFSGGAVFCTAEGPEFMATEQWLQGRAGEYRLRSQGARRGVKR